MTTATLPRVKPRAAQNPTKGPGRRSRPTLQGRHFEDHIEGRYRTIPARELALAWWLFSTSHIDKLELRLWFAAQEMAERRHYGRTRSKREQPVFTIDEVQHLVGGRGNPRSARKQQAALRRLSELGLLQLSKNSLTFAKSIDALTVGEGGRAAFRAFLEALPNSARTVPVPRRLLRALAAGFSKADTAYVIAFLLHAVFWHRDAGRYTVDGRMKLSRVSRLFGISPRAFTDARTRLIELGWIKPLEVQQWLANRYGVHDVVNVHWSRTQPANEEKVVERPAVGEGSGDLGSASPRACFDTQSASPDQTLRLSTKDTNTRRPTQAAGPAGGSFKDGSKKSRAAKPSQPIGEPTIRDIRAGDLVDTDRLFKLHRQFVDAGLAKDGRAGELDFLALANRARVRGFNPGGLLRRLLQQNRTGWITIADEEAACQRMREHLNGPRPSDGGRQGMQAIQNVLQPDSTQGRARRGQRLSAESRFVEKCIRVARQTGLQEANWWRVAKETKRWTRDQWQAAYECYQFEQARHWHSGELEAIYA